MVSMLPIDFLHDAINNFAKRVEAKSAEHIARSNTANSKLGNIGPIPENRINDALDPNHPKISGTA